MTGDRSENAVAAQPAEPLRVAVIGCGAVAARAHLPALAAARDVELALLVDVSQERAKLLAAQYGVANVADDYRRAAELADAAVIALPNHLHAPVAIDLLNRGVHVLVEKPMALSSAECGAMRAAAAATGATLAVGLEFRFCSDSRFVKSFFSGAMLGSLASFDLRMGLELDWPLTSDYLFRKEKAGGGVLMDFGAHLLDLLLWWLGDLAVVDYADDAFAGVEADCEIVLQSAAGARGKVELSRTRRLRNSCIFTGARGCLEVSLWLNEPRLRLTLDGGDVALVGRFDGAAAVLDMPTAFACQLADFVAAIRLRRQPFVSGNDGERALRLIEACYRHRRPLALPWLET